MPKSFISTAPFSSSSPQFDNGIPVDEALNITSANYLTYTGATLYYSNAWGITFDATLEDTGFECSIVSYASSPIGISTSLPQLVPSVAGGNAVENAATGLCKVVGVTEFQGNLNIFGDVIND